MQQQFFFFLVKEKENILMGFAACPHPPTPPAKTLQSEEWRNRFLSLSLGKD